MQKFISHNMFQQKILHFDHENNQNKIRNSAKVNQIQILQREVDLYALSSRLQTLNKDEVCKECLRKDQQIQTLIKALKALRSTVTNSRESLKKSEDKIEEEYSKITTQVKNQDIFELSAEEYNVFQKTCDGKMQKKEAILQDKFEFQLLKLRSQNKVCLEEIQALRKKLQLCEKKAFILQQTNKSLRREYDITSLKKNIVDKLSSLEHKQKKEVAPEELTHDDVRKRLPTFSSMRANVTKQPVVRGPEHRQPITPRPNIFQQTLTSRNSDRKNGFSTTRYHSRQEDLIEQRKRSLDHKIKILQVQNHKLRKQVYRTIS